MVLLILGFYLTNASIPKTPSVHNFAQVLLNAFSCIAIILKSNQYLVLSGTFIVDMRLKIIIPS
ncbi:hypothetical protein [Helicobacter cynogastricus]|uniref:hypothetical protein n=1 Tax=Helicobacter cynogastricus TaxID=329937 RepID=UPI0013154101|nr:hypothetical protein [Helicobacter cynogastricus]